MFEESRKRFFNETKLTGPQDIPDGNGAIKWAKGKSFQRGQLYLDPVSDKLYYTLVDHIADDIASDLGAGFVAEVTTSTSDSNIYNTDGVLTANRTLGGGGFDLCLGEATDRIENFKIIANVQAAIVTQDLTGNESEFISDIANIHMELRSNAGADVQSIVINPTDMTVRDTANTKGLIYAADYSSNFVDESLVTKRYVDAAVIADTSIYGNDGTLTADRTMSGDTKNLTLGTVASPLNNFTVNTEGDFNLHAEVNDGDQWDVQIFTDVLAAALVLRSDRNTDETTVSIGADDVKITASVANFKGATYAADYSADFIDESLVTKRYVDSVVSAGNGIYDGSGTLQAGATVATLPTGASFEIAGDFAGTAFKVDGDTGKVTMDGLVDPTGLQLTQVAANPGDANTLWVSSGDGKVYKGAVNLEETDGNGIYDGPGTVPTAAISTLTDYWRIDSGDVSIDTGGVPAAKLHVKGENDSDGLRVDVDIWNNAFLVQELGGVPFVSVFSSTKVSNEIFRVAGGNAMFSSNITVGGAPGGFTAIAQPINIPDNGFIGFGVPGGGATSNPIFGHSGTATIIDMIASGSVEFRNNSDVVVATLINNTGNFGVGTSLTPLEKLHIDGNARVDGRLMVTHDNFSFGGTTVNSYIANNLGNMLEFTDGGGVNFNNYANGLGAPTGTQDFNSNFYIYKLKSTINSSPFSDEIHLHFQANQANSSAGTKMGINIENTSNTDVLQINLDESSGARQSADVTVLNILDNFGAHDVDLAGATKYKTGQKISLTDSFTTTTTGSGVVRALHLNAQGGDVNEALYVENGESVLALATSQVTTGQIDSGTVKTLVTKEWVNAQGFGGGGGTTVTAQSTNYTAADGDFVLMTTGATDKTVTLPLAASSTNAVIEVKKVDGAAGDVIIDGNGAETIDGNTTVTIATQYTSLTLHCDGIEWHVK